MDWFRAYHSMSTDPKLHVIARVAKVPRGLIVGAWIAILSEASQASERGDVSEVSVEKLTYLIDVKPGVAKRIHDAIWASNLIADNRVAAWEKRQKISDDVQKRVSHHRDQKAKALADNDIGVGGNVTKSARTEQNRPDKKEVDKSTSKDAAPSGADDRQAVAVVDRSSLPLKDRYPTRGKLHRNGHGIEYPPEYEAFWQQYPTRSQDPKAECYDKWRKSVVVERIPPERIIDGAEAYAAVWAGHEYRWGARRWLEEQAWNHPVPTLDTRGTPSRGRQKSAAEEGHEMFMATLEEMEAKGNG